MGCTVAILREDSLLTMGDDKLLHLAGTRQEVARQVYERNQFFIEVLINASVPWRVR